MWTCPNCNAANESPLADCARCGFARPAIADASGRVVFRTFRGRLATWNALFEDAAAFASSVGRERVISISHSGDQGDGVVTVWYWE
jgi:hypothetical protein